jgi:hypothetical protein
MTHEEEQRGPAFWIGLAVGAAVIAYGVRGVLADADATRPLSFATWLVGADVVHDALVAPLVALVAWPVVRLGPVRWRAPLLAGLFGSAVVLAIAWAPLRGYGRATVPDNGSVQPLDYTTATATVLAVVWLAVSVWILVRHWSDHAERPRRRPRPAPARDRRM